MSVFGEDEEPMENLKSAESLAKPKAVQPSGEVRVLGTRDSLLLLTPSDPRMA